MKILITLAILVIVSSICLADSIEFDRTGDKTQIQICVEKPISGKVGAFAYSCQTKTWSETYAGLTYSPRPKVQLALGAGQETGGNRVGGWIWVGKGRFSAIYILEDGKSGTWDKFVLKYQTTNDLALGWSKKQFAGSGILVEYKLNKTTTIKYTGFKEPELALSLGF